MPRLRRRLRLLAAVAALAAATVGPAAPPPASAAAADAPSAPVAASAGYWLVAADGGVFTFGGAPFFGSVPSGTPEAPGGGVRLNRPVVGMAATPTGRGYWLVASDGGVFTFGDAAFLGSTGGMALNRPIVGLAATPSGRGYWLVASDGGVFTFGDAAFLGSTGHLSLRRPVVSVTPTPTGLGYWLVASDGGVFTFGDARFHGSLPGSPHRPRGAVAGLVATPSGSGYWLLTTEGAVVPFGDAPALGSMEGARLAGSVAGAAAAPRGLGYWLVASDGGVFSFGDSGFAGSLGGTALAAPVVGMAARPVVLPPEVGIFTYPWYATMEHDQHWRHWEQNGKLPPADIGANFYPADGIYSSLDPRALAAQARQIAATGVDQVISSWWGRGDFEDWNLPDTINATRAAGLRFAVHLEPYVGRSPATVAADLEYLRRYDIRDVYLYLIDDRPAAEWAPVTARFDDFRFFGETGNLDAMLSGGFAAYAAEAGFDGIYTYDAVRYGLPELAATCAAARQRRLLCAPSVAPGYDGRRAKPWDAQLVERNGGARYDDMWAAATAAGGDVVTVTSWNEWHEGTQIEPARPFRFPDGYFSPGYEGAYGRTGLSARTAYVDRTREWAATFRSRRTG